MPRRLFWILLGLAVALGVIIGYVDSRPTWDDTGITVGTILIISGLLGMALPERAWLWALAVGIWVPVFGVAKGPVHIDPVILVLPLGLALAGAYIGAATRRGLNMLMHPNSTSTPQG